ncbi:MAG: cytochrome c [Rhodospirillaceae bacterium]|nr:cytochrome c [Rhodospirillaceae bacterium]
MGIQAYTAISVFAAIVGLSMGAVATGADMAPERRADLMNLLVQDCGSCHGLTMKGGLGSPLLPANLEGKDADVLAEVILDGIPDTPMPPWRGQLTEAEAIWMAEQLKKGIK